MRMRKKKNLAPRMEACGAYLIRDPFALRGRWRELMPEARELRVELGCGKGGFTVGTAAAEPEVLLIAVVHQLLRPVALEQPEKTAADPRELS